MRVMVDVDTRVGAWVAMVGGTGAGVGVTAFEAEEALLVPIAFTAYTWKVYETLLVRSETTIGEPEDVAVMLPGVDEAR